MKILCYGIVLYSLAFIIHLVIWKVRIPKNQTKALLQIFLITIITCFSIMLNLPSSFSLFGIPILHTFSEYLHVSIFYISMMLAYVVFYSAIEADSPSLEIIRLIDSTGKSGAKKEDLRKIFVAMPFLESRIGSLIDDKLVCEVDGKYLPTKRGIILLHIISFYRYLFSMQKGG